MQLLEEVHGDVSSGSLFMGVDQYVWAGWGRSSGQWQLKSCGLPWLDSLRHFSDCFDGIDRIP